MLSPSFTEPSATQAPPAEQLRCLPEPIDTFPGTWILSRNLRLWLGHSGAGDYWMKVSAQTAGSATAIAELAHAADARMTSLSHTSEWRRILNELLRNWGAVFGAAILIILVV